MPKNSVPTANIIILDDHIKNTSPKRAASTAAYITHSFSPKQKSRNINDPIQSGFVILLNKELSVKVDTKWEIQHTADTIIPAICKPDILHIFYFIYIKSQTKKNH